MTDFIVTITDPELLAGITWAREAHNAATTPEPPPPVEGEELLPPPEPAAAWCETDADYVQWVMEQAAVSYAQQQLDAQWREAYQAQKFARGVVNARQRQHPAGIGADGREPAGRAGAGPAADPAVAPATRPDGGDV